MDTDRFNRSLNYWLNLINRRGHAGIFAQDHEPGTRQIVELGVANDFAEALFKSSGIMLERIRTNPNDPPDCFATLNGVDVGIELVELVDGNAIAIAQSQGRTSYNDVAQFEACQWSKERFLRAMDCQINAKSQRYAKRGLRVDCLLIYSAEPWLLPQDVEIWIRELESVDRENFRSIFFMMEYDPAYSRDHCPIFKVCGDFRNGPIE